MTKGNTLKQGDKTPLKYRLFDADGEKLNIAGKSAKVRLVYPDFLTIGYEKDGLTVSQDDTVTFTIDGVIPSRIYHVEIIVDNKFVFPSRSDEAKFTVDKSSLGTEANIIEIVGVDQIVNTVLGRVDADINQAVTDITATNEAIKQAEQERVQGYQEIKQIIEDGVLNAEPKDGSVTTPKVADKAITNSKLSETHNEKGVVSSGSLNDYLVTGTYLFTAAVTDNPLGSGGFLIVETGATGIVVQYATRLNTSNDLYFRTVRTVTGVTTFYDWRKVNLSENKQLPAGTDLNTLTASGEYLLSGTPVNAPSGYGVSMLNVSSVGGWVTQTITKAAFPKEIYLRSFYYSGGDIGNLSDWVSIGGSDGIVNRQLNTGEDLNTVLAEGTYLALASNPNIPTGAGAGLLVVKRQGIWINQEYTSVTDPNLSFKRTTNESGSIRSNWEQIVTKSSLAGSSNLGLAGKTVVNFGDSIFGNVRGVSSVSQAIADNSGAEVINVGFGGSFASQRPDADWNEMTFYKLSDCISSGDYSSLNREPVRSLRDYFSEHIDKLMSINWNNVDIITLAYGTNDFTGYKTLDNTSDKFDVDTYGGALRYGLRNIMTAYPHLKVLIITPIYRYYLDKEGNFIEDSDTRVESGGSFRGFVEKAMEIAQEFKVPYLNAHDKLGINRYNKDIYFNAPDTTHPNPTGNKKYGELIARKLIAGS